MRLLVDATPLLLRSAGVKTYVYYWLLHLRRAAGAHRVEMFPLIEELGAMEHERSVAGRARTAAGVALLGACNHLGGPFLRWLGARTDIFHHASQQLRAAPRGCRTTATLYDMTCWQVPETHTPANVRANHRFAARVLRQAAGMIAISEHTREDAVRCWGWTRTASG